VATRSLPLAVLIWLALPVQFEAACFGRLQMAVNRDGRVATRSLPLAVLIWLAVPVQFEAACFGRT